jgi:hypothetical protein
MYKDGKLKRNKNRKELKRGGVSNANGFLPCDSEVGNTLTVKTEWTNFVAGTTETYSQVQSWSKFLCQAVVGTKINLR